MTAANRTLPLALLAASIAALAVSGWQPADRATWWMEIAPVLVAWPVLVLTCPRFPLTPLVYWLIFVHGLILMLGGHYTYAKVPLGFWMEEAFGFARNHYDRIGHFAQGFVPAIVAREVLIRNRVVARGAWLFFLVSCVCLAVSALYELVEWRAAVMGGDAADAFLGTQGDPWDTQEDMFTALVGAMVAQVLLAKWHDAQIANLAR